MCPGLSSIGWKIPSSCGSLRCNSGPWCIHRRFGRSFCLGWPATIINMNELRDVWIGGFWQSNPRLKPQSCDFCLGWVEPASPLRYGFCAGGCGCGRSQPDEPLHCGGSLAGVRIYCSLVDWKSHIREKRILKNGCNRGNVDDSPEEFQARISNPTG